MKRRPKGPVELELSSPTLRDYALYQSGNEAPVSYHVFSLLAYRHTKSYTNEEAFQ